MTDHPKLDRMSTGASLLIEMLRPRGDDTTLNWTTGGLCAQVDPDLFYPQSVKRERRVRAAKQLCRQCPVTADCLEYALRTGEEHGIWGGTTAGERFHMRGLRGIAPQDVSGT